MRENGMPDTSDRLTRVETLLNVSLENQTQNRTRLHDIANNVQVLGSRIEQLDRRLETTDVKSTVEEIDKRVEDLDRKLERANVRSTVEEIDKRVEILEQARASVLTAWVILKWAGCVTAAFFTLSVALGEKIAKLPIWGIVK